MIANVARLESLMDREGLDAVVARSGINFTYLSGIAYPGTLARHLELPDSPRGVFLVWPRGGEPVIVLNAIAEQLTRRDSWVEKIEVYEGYAERPVHRLCKVLRDIGVSDGRVGFERDYVSALDWEEIRSSLPRLTMTNATGLMDEVRWIKTEGEIALLKRAADLLDDAYLEVFPTIKDGESERAVHSRLIASCLRRGAGWAHGILNSDKNTIPYAGESDHQFRKGDAVRTDYVAYLEGYPGHQSRSAVLGKPTDEQIHEYANVRDIYRAMMDRCVPGASAADLYRFVRERFEAIGRPYKSILAGHSVGCWWHQQEPVISRTNETPLEEGMVLALEPHVDHWHIQDMVLVRRNGPELLSDRIDTSQPFIIDM